ncbi:type II secretion system F family protein [Planktothrix paucivesiculata]|uniref:Pilin biogenesis protein n=1 Tax=Planktothrix paucivesiculata PCC 9631 TaxID=671071 RepID=A0A7Z9BU31_9CYAN|nr:type II secretion system F family protein [Planktothrix paucivesiculata]VXD20788.1 Pilin biogenesis protein [Planktothrix paucivesiculata PCC 9631]
MNPREKALFFFQLATLLNSGLTVEQSLTLVGKDSYPQLGRYLNKMTAATSRGGDLASALALASRYFDRWTIGLISLGESQGMLPEICYRISEIEERKARHQNLYRSVTLAAITTGISILLLILTLFYLSGLSGQWWFLILGIFALIILAIPKILPRLSIIKKISTARMMLYLGELKLPLICGMSLLAGLELVRAHIPKSEMKASITMALGQIPAEKTLSQSLEGRLPAVALQMLRTGEATGQLDLALQKLTNYYEEELEQTLRRLQSVLVPATIVMAGTVVLLLALQALKSLLILLPK